MLKLVSPESNRGNTQYRHGQHNQNAPNTSTRGKTLVATEVHSLSVRDDLTEKVVGGWVKLDLSLGEKELTIAAKKSFSKVSTADLERWPARPRWKSNNMLHAHVPYDSVQEDVREEEKKGGKWRKFLKEKDREMKMEEEEEGGRERIPISAHSEFTSASISPSSWRYLDATTFAA